MAWVEEVIAWLSEKFVYDEVGPELDRLSAVLRDGVVDQRLSAIRQLTFMKAADSVALLIGALKDEEPRVRGAAAEGLGYKASVEAVAPIAVLLSDPDAEVRTKALGALDDIGLPAAGPSPGADRRIPDLLARALVDPDVGVRSAALGALSRHGARGVTIVREHLVSIESGPAETQAKELEAAEPGLITALQAREPEHRRAAVEAVHRLCGARAVRHLAAALADVSPEVRRAAVEAVTALGPQPALPELLESLRDPDAGVVEKVIEGLVAARALGSFQPYEEDRIHEELIRLARFEGPARETAAWALGEMGRVSAVSTLCDILGDPKDAVAVEAACVALGKINDPRAVGPLLRSLESLGSAAGSTAGSAACAAASIRALARSEDVRVMPVLVGRLFGGADPVVEKALEEALHALCGAVEDAAREELSSPDREIRLAAVRRAISEPRLVLLLLRAALDAPDDETRSAALEVLARQGYDLASLARSTLTLPDKTEAWRVLAINLAVVLKTPDAEELLGRLLADQNEPLGVYRHAVSALRRLGTDAAREALRRHAEHPQADVRNAVAEALAPPS